jgi:3-deoxy-D-manno-octulosonic-acid transferase
MKNLYNTGYYILLPLIVLYTYAHQLLTKRPAGLRQRFARQHFHGQAGGIWVHAASVGEVNAAKPMIDKLLQTYTKSTLIITTQTMTGLQRVQALYKNQVYAQLMPFDIANFIHRFLTTTTPQLLIIMETELWPNLIHACHQRQIPMIIANGRISTRAFKRYRICRRFFLPSLEKLTQVLCQSTLDAHRYQYLGVPAEQVRVLGNLKYACEIPPTIRHQAAQLRQSWGTDPVLIAASTHAHEEEIILQAFAQIKLQCPILKLILMPRHPQRVAQIWPLCSAWQTVLRSQLSTTSHFDILVIDSLGEGLLWYGCADIAFVGGSLVPVGGHNPIEPGLWGLPTLCGPHMENFAAVMADLKRLNAIKVINTASQLAETVLDYRNNGSGLSAARAAQKFITLQAQTLQKYMDAIKVVIT